MYYVYVIQSEKDKNLYTGYTPDLQRRIKLHNLGKIFSTKSRKPFRLIYYEAYQNKYDALEREKFLKSGWGRNYIKKILKRFFAAKEKVGRASS